MPCMLALPTTLPMVYAVVVLLRTYLAKRTVFAPLNAARTPLAAPLAASVRISIYFGTATAARIPRMMIMMISSISVKPFEFLRIAFIVFLLLTFIIPTYKFCSNINCSCPPINPPASNIFPLSFPTSQSLFNRARLMNTYTVPGLLHIILFPSSLVLAWLCAMFMPSNLSLWHTFSLCTTCFSPKCRAALPLLTASLRSFLKHLPASPSQRLRSRRPVICR